MTAPEQAPPSTKSFEAEALLACIRAGGPYGKLARERIRELVAAVEPIQWAAQLARALGISHGRAKRLLRARASKFSTIADPSAVEPVEYVKRGFALVAPEKLREWGRRGGQKSHATGRAYEFDSTSGSAASKLRKRVKAAEVAPAAEETSPNDDKAA